MYYCVPVGESLTSLCFLCVYFEFMDLGDLISISFGRWLFINFFVKGFIFEIGLWGLL